MQHSTSDSSEEQQIKSCQCGDVVVYMKRQDVFRDMKWSHTANETTWVGFFIFTFW